MQVYELSDDLISIFLLSTTQLCTKYYIMSYDFNIYITLVISFQYFLLLYMHENVWCYLAPVFLHISSPQLTGPRIPGSPQGDNPLKVWVINCHCDQAKLCVFQIVLKYQIYLLSSIRRELNTYYSFLAVIFMQCHSYLKPRCRLN